MLIEDILLLIIGGGAVFLLGVPVVQLYNRLFPKKRDSLAEAKQRLEQARMDAEAAQYNKEAEKIYNDLYEETLQEDEDETTDNKHRRV